MAKNNCEVSRNMVEAGKKKCDHGWIIQFNPYTRIAMARCLNCLLELKGIMSDEETVTLPRKVVEEFVDWYKGWKNDNPVAADKNLIYLSSILLACRKALEDQK